MRGNLLHKEQIYVCPVCNAKSHSKPTLRQHIKKHGANLLFRNECDYSSINPSGLKNHIKVKHIGVQISCDLCEYSSTSNKCLKDHKLVKHLGKQLKCDECNSKFYYESGVKRHKLVEHEGHRYGCNECAYVVKDPGVLKRHKHSERPIVKLSGLIKTYQL